MAKGKRASPGIGRAGHNSGLPAIADVRSALAIEMLFEEQFKKLREKHKVARKKIEGMNVRLDDLNFLKGMRDKAGSEVIEEFKRHWHLVGAIHEDQTEQLDIFAPKPSAPEVRHAHFTMGLMVGLKGEELVIPPNIQGDDRDQMIKGHNEGRQKRADAMELAMGGDGEAPKDAAKEKPAAKAAKVADAAAKDFSEDQQAAGAEDPLVVNGERYANMRQANAARARLAAQAQETTARPAPEPDITADGRKAKFWDDYPEDNAAWTDEQKDAFRSWFDELPNGATIEIDHGGAAAEFARLEGLTSDVDGAEEVRPDDADAGAATGGFLDDPAPTVGDDAKPPATPAPVKRPVMRPDFQDWDTDWLKWSGSQEMEFRRWFDSLPEGSVPAITHEGAVAAFRAMREEQQNRSDAGPDDGEEDARPAPPSEPEVDMSPEALDAKARELAASGFVPPKNTRRGKRA